MYCQLHASLQKLKPIIITVTVMIIFCESNIELATLASRYHN